MKAQHVLMYTCMDGLAEFYHSWSDPWQLINACELYKKDYKGFYDWNEY
jgi:hypothetical protein